jgi:hypothetical protein
MAEGSARRRLPLGKAGGAEDSAAPDRVQGRVKHSPRSRFRAAFAVAIVTLACVPLCAGAASAAGTAAAPADAAGVVQRVAEAYAEQSRGVVGFHTHVAVRTVERVVPHDQTDEAWFVYEDGRVVRSAGDPNGPAAAEAAAHQPYDVRYLGEYAYASAACAGCAAGTVAIAYTGAPHDALHARGVLVIDTRLARIVRSTTQPYVVPRPGRSGSLTTTWGATDAGWFPVATDGTFAGRVGPFSGRATLTQRFSGYKRFHDVAAAERALAG